MHAMGRRLVRSHRVRRVKQHKRGEGDVCNVHERRRRGMRSARTVAEERHVENEVVAGVLQVEARGVVEGQQQHERLALVLE